MIVSCSKCDSKYSVEDSKVEGKRFGFVCPKCGENVEIDNRVKSEELHERMEEQLNEELFEESTDTTTGEESDTGIGLPGETAADLDADLDESKESADIEPEEEDLLKEVDELGSIGADIEDDFNISESDNDIKPDITDEEIELPDGSLNGDSIGISDGADEEEMDDSLSLDGMELPDLENLADISETGETAEDAINITDQEIPETEDNLLQEEPILHEEGPGIEETEDNFEEIDISSDTLDEPEIVSGDDETDSGLIDDFSPIEEDVEETGIEDITTDETEDEEKLELNAEDMVGLEDINSGEIFSGNNDSDNDTGDEDEDITIDLDSLDIQLEEDDEEAGVSVDMEVEEISDSAESLMSESLEITDLESDETENILSDISDEISEEPEVNIQDETAASAAEETEGEDEDITLDLDALDLTLDEVEELKEGEVLGDDERLSLSDAGLTPDELVEEKASPSAEEPEEDLEEEDIRISVDEVAPDVEIDKKRDMEEMQFEDFDQDDELPEIDFEEFEEDTEFETMDIEPLPEDFEQDTIQEGKNFKDHEAELSSLDIDIRDTVPGGMINFSIDYSFNFSRLGALFRLICLYPVILIPHFIVLILYSVLSTLLSFFNYIIILFSGVHEEDFTSVQENTIRYFLSLAACAADIVEDIPKFAGKKDIDYPFQLDATYPVTRSRILAFLRLTVVGILIAALPHLILLLILSLGSILIYLIGLISIIITKKWPKSLFDFMARYYKYWSNVLSFITGVIDRYPSFKFE